jgi:hypothetical protein
MRGGGGLDEAAEALIGLTGDGYMDAGQAPDAQVRGRVCGRTDINEGRFAILLK